MKKVKFTLLLILTAIFLAACGDATMEPANESYEPRIVIQGFLQAGKNIERIYITRNFPLYTNLSNISLIPDPDKTTVQVTDMESNQVYRLDFTQNGDKDLKDFYWAYQESDCIIKKGNSYRLDVWTMIAGKSLYASSVTTVPVDGFEIISQNYQYLGYRETDSDGRLKEFRVEINRSAGTMFYAAAVQALNPSLETFIYDNPYEDVQPEDVDLVDDALSYEIIHHAPETEGVSIMPFGWQVFNFYDRYRIIIYATDENYKDYLLTYQNVMEMDGNFHEAKFNINGDGIGVFGSLIADTVYVEIVR